jgi:hypothetical protein
MRTTEWRAGWPSIGWVAGLTMGLLGMRVSPRAARGQDARGTRSRRPHGLAVAGRWSAALVSRRSTDGARAG